MAFKSFVTSYSYSTLFYRVPKPRAKVRRTKKAVEIRSTMNNELRNAVCFIKDRLYFLSSKNIAMRDTQFEHFVCPDDKYVYEPFYNDFGPVHLGHTISFCRLMEQKMKNPSLLEKKIYVLTSLDGHKRANASYLICAYMVIVQGKTPEEAYKPFINVYPPFIPFRDPSQSISTFNLTILDCLKGLAKAIIHKFLVYDTFNTEEYYHYEKVENGDMNWILPGKFLAFSSPASRRITPDGMIHLTPDDYYPIFKKWNITAVVRLNKKLYDKKQFTNYGINHYDMYYVDGGLPPEPILTKFLEIAQTEKGGIAVHCKAGLGRTGTLIGMYIMKHYHFTASEVIAWLRIVRPGSVIGIQQHYLKDMQSRMWKQGEQLFQQYVSTVPGLANSLAMLENSNKNTIPTSPSSKNSPLSISTPLLNTNGQIFTRNSTIPPPISTTKMTTLPPTPTSPIRVTSVLSKSNMSPLSTPSNGIYVNTQAESPSHHNLSSSILERPQRSNRPMTTTGLSRSIPVLTQILQSNSISDNNKVVQSATNTTNSYSKRLITSASPVVQTNFDQEEPRAYGRSTFARDTNSIAYNATMHSNIINSTINSSLTPTSLRTSNMANSSINSSSLFGSKNTNISGLVNDKPIKKMHHLTEMNNKYIPNRQSKQNILLKSENENLSPVLNQYSDHSRGGGGTNTNVIQHFNSLIHGRTMSNSSDNK